MKLKRLNKILFCITVFICGISNCRATNYYVNDSWSNSDIYCTQPGLSNNDGLSPSSPKRLLSEIFNAYSSQLSGNDTIFIDWGNYEDEISIGQLNFSKNSPLTIIGASKTDTKIESSSPNTNVLNIENCSHINLSKINFESNSLRTNTIAGASNVITINDCDNITVDNCQAIRNKDEDALVSIFGASSKLTISNSLLRHNEYQSTGVKITGNSSNDKVKYISILNSTIRLTRTDTNGLAASDAIELENTDSIYIQKNKIHSYDRGIRIWDNSNNTFTTNNFITTNTNAGIYFKGGTSTYGIIAYNSFNNIAESNNGSACLVFSDNNNDENSTIGWSIYNNIFNSNLNNYNMWFYTTTADFDSIDYNSYYRQNTLPIVNTFDFTQWQNYDSDNRSGFAGDTNSIYLNPQYLNDSVLIPQNTNLKFGLAGYNNTVDDIYHRTRLSPTTVGAYDLYTGLNGNYSINPNETASYTNYQSPEDVLKDLKGYSRSDGGPNNGPDLAGNCMFEIEDGIYQLADQLLFEDYQNNRFSMKFNSKSRNAENVTFEAVYNKPVIYITGSFNNNILFKNINFTTSNASYSASLVKIYGSGSDSIRDITFDSCKFTGGEYGVRIFGGLKVINTTINQCEFIEQSFYSLFINNVQSDTNPVANFTNNSIISNNFSNHRAIRIQNANKLNIANNSVIMNNIGNTNTYAVYLFDSDDISFIHNSISVSEPSALTDILRINNCQELRAINNNLSQNGNGKVYALFGSNLVINNNNTYKSALSSFAYSNLSGTHSTFEDWQLSNSSAYDQNSVSIYPFFIDPYSNLRLDCSSPNLLRIAEFLSDSIVQIDVDGNSRGNDVTGINNYVGFHEFQTGDKLSGDYLITSNSTPDSASYEKIYYSISDAIADINCRGINGTVTFYLGDPVYENQQFILSSTLVDNGSDHTVHFTSLDSLNKSRIQYGQSANNLNYIFKLNNPNYNVAFSKIDFLRNTGDYDKILHSTGTFKNLTITHCSFTSNSGVINYNDENNLISIIDCNSESEVIINNNIFEKGSQGIIIRSLSGSESQVSISKNQFLDQNKRGVYLKDVVVNDFNHNVFNYQNLQTDSVAAISLNRIIATAGSRTVLESNKILMSKSSTLFNSHAAITIDNSTMILLKNNIIFVADGKTNLGIYSSNSNDLQLLHNSILISGDSSGVIAANNSQINLCKNNIFVTDSSAGNYCYQANTANNLSNFDFNNIVSPTILKTSSQNIISIPDLPNVLGNSNSANSISVNPQFTSNSDLNLTENSPDILNFGDTTVINDADRDYLYKIRDNPPTLGAYEYQRALVWVEADGGAWSSNESWRLLNGDRSNAIPGEGDIVTLNGDLLNSTMCDNPNNPPTITIDEHHTIKSIIYEGNCSPAIVITENGSLSILQ